MKKITLNTPEPSPIKNNEIPVWDQVIIDMEERNKEGQERYGTILQAFNGRNPLIDAYQETLDKAVYLKQAILEREHMILALQEIASYVNMDDPTLIRLIKFLPTYIKNKL